MLIYYFKKELKMLNTNAVRALCRCLCRAETDLLSRSSLDLRTVLSGPTEYKGCCDTRHKCRKPDWRTESRTGWTTLDWLTNVNKRTRTHTELFALSNYSELFAKWYKHEFDRVSTVRRGVEDWLALDTALIKKHNEINLVIDSTLALHKATWIV